MTESREIVLDLEGGGKLAVLAEPVGPQLVGESQITAKLGDVTGPIAKVGTEMLQALKSARPEKATVEVGFGLAVQEGHLISLLGKGRGEATIKITLEWSKPHSDEP